MGLLVVPFFTASQGVVLEQVTLRAAPMLPAGFVGIRIMCANVVEALSWTSDWYLAGGSHSEA